MLGGLKQCLLFSQSSGSQKSDKGFAPQKSMSQHGHASRDTRDKSISLTFPASEQHPYSLVHDPVSHHHFLSSCFLPSHWLLVFQISLCLSLLRTCMITFRVNLYNPGLSPHLSILNLITSARSLLSDKVTLTGSRD